MKFKFKVQGYQTDAVEATVGVFEGQPSHDAATQRYRRDLGDTNGKLTGIDDEGGYRNADIELNSKQLMDNINAIQLRQQIEPSHSLATGLGAVNLDIEMETGTGKTYVYIKTMHELRKRFGWSKFIVVVPSIAIREGVAKSFKMLEEHFMEQYGEKARWFVYDSKNLQQLDTFSSSASLSVMIINTQAFAASLKEGGRSKESRIIYTKRDEFGSRRPIDVIAANRPIIIMDEPQKMEGAVTQTALAKFAPLFMLNYSATHKTKHDTIYALDAYDAYRQRLVKRIKVKGFEVRNLQGTSGYMYLDNIVLSPKRPPQARIEIEVKLASGNIKRMVKTFAVGDSLAAEAGGLGEYDGFTVSEISHRGYVTFTNGKTLVRGQVVGDSNERAMQRVQIRETIRSHFEKERTLYRLGIKCLSLFFIDEVANYRQYDDEGNEVKGPFQEIFEEEYARAVQGEFHIFDEDYNEYLRRFTPQDVHRGYFSIDKKGRAVNSDTKRGTDISDDISAYDLILKNKERLLSFEEPTRFIFSHSALREGWDNPNVFQICTLRHSNSTTAKRQEVGRGLRICVNANGERQDRDTLGDDVHKINMLTVIANESYAGFSGALQKEIHEVLRQRATFATHEYFMGKVVKVDGQDHTITDGEASRIMVYLEDNEYVDAFGNITPKYHEDVAAEAVAPYGAKLAPMAEGVTTLINSVFDPSVLKGMVEDDTPATLPEPKLNDNFSREEFQALWREINHQYVYTVTYNSEELIEKSVAAINRDLTVKQLRYVKVEGMQGGDEDRVDVFAEAKSDYGTLSEVSTSTVRYDMVGEIARGANLTRRTVCRILGEISQAKLLLFKNNPEEFIRNVIRIIREQKAAMIVDHIRYEKTEGKYSSDIFTAASRAEFSKAVETTKHITDYVVADSQGERDFAHDLDVASEVVVYAKLPRSFQIPTPVGNYAPDWAIAMQRGDVKHIFFIAETKGSLSSMDITPIEQAKIDCCSRLFNEMSTAKVHYHKVTKYQDLIDAMTSL